ncbi:MAG: arsenate reductase (azurin) large subunit, partial [Pseudomonadota bacterium]
ETTAWYSPSMYNIVKQDGKDVHLVIKPDPDCVVNSGLGSVRGARMAENHTSQQRGTQLERLTDPMVWRYGSMQPTSWDDALDLVARVTAAVINEQGEDGLFVSMFDHGGSGGGYENTWGTGKLYFGAMKIKNVRIHNRPAYNSEVHATRDMGVGELNNCYEDAELADTIVAIGTNALETQTNYFLNHWVPNLRGTSLDKKRREFAGEAVEPGRIIIVDPRRTVTVAACEAEAGKDRVLHLALESGTDLVLFNALLTYIADKGWVDKAFIAASTLPAAQAAPLLSRPGGTLADQPLTDFASALAANRTSIEEAAKITGLRAEDIVKAAHWIAEPKAGGKRRRAMFGYEKGIIWGNDNYRTNGAIVNLALATGNVGRPGGGVVRLGGHQEGYSRPSDAHVGRPAAYVDKLLIEGRGGVHHIWACDHYKTTLNAFKLKQVYKRRTDMVKDAMNTVPWGDRKAMVDAIMVAIRQGGLFSVDVDIVPTQIGQASHVWLPAAISGEMNLTSMNGERRMRLTERYMDPPGNAMPDCLIAARLANAMERVLREQGKAAYADQFKGFDWKTEEDAFMDGYHKHEKGGEHVTYARLKAMGNNGFQEPATGFANGQIVGTKRLYADGKFSTKDGKARFMATPWRGLQAPGKAEQKAKYKFLINNGRTNVVWQNAFMDQHNDFVSDRMPYPFIEMNPDDMKEIGAAAGDLVEIYNDSGSTQAMVQPTPSAKRGQTFMLFGYPTGVQGNVVNAGVNELIIPNYKQTWADIRKIASAPETTRQLSFKSPEYET